MSRPAGLIFIFFCLLALFVAQSEGTTCYSYSGKEWPDQQQCEGSDACCGTKDTCLPNRLCKSQDTADNILIRGPCLSTPWDRSNCAQICVFNETTQNTGLENFVFPRVEICDDNTYCCRQGNTPCCSLSRGKVYLDDNGNLLSAAPSKTSSTTVASSTLASSTSTTLSTTTSEPSQDPTPSSSASGSDTADESTASNNEYLALKVGLGVGVPSAALVAALATWFLCRKRRNKNDASEMPTNLNYPYGEGPEVYNKSSTHRQSRNTSYWSPAREMGRDEMHEMPGNRDERWDGTPRELMGTEVREGQQR